MKKILLTIGIFFFIGISFAQIWAPVGAKWYYSHYAGAPDELTIIESIGDTMINTKQCKILKTIEIYEVMSPTGIYSWDTLYCPLQYTYQDTSKIYLADLSTNNFDLLYDFQANENDTITVKDMAFGGYCPGGVPSNLFEYSIDSLTDTILNGLLLSKQYILPTPNSDWVFSDLSGITGNDLIIENLGSLKYLFGVYHLQAMEGSIKGLRCYKGGNLNYKASFWSDTLPCSYLRPLHEIGIATIDTKMQVDIYPNPSSSGLFIDLKHNINTEFTIEIYSIIGKLQLRQTYERDNSYIDIEKLPNGLYLIRIHDGRQTFTSKFVKE